MTDKKLHYAFNTINADIFDTRIRVQALQDTFFAWLSHFDPEMKEHIGDVFQATYMRALNAAIEKLPSEELQQLYRDRIQRG